MQRCRPAQRANTNYLRPYQGYSNITQRRSDAFSDYNSVQFYLNKRRGDLKYSVSYTLAKVTGLGSGNGDNPLEDEGWRPTDNVDYSYFVGPTSFDRRHVSSSSRPTRRRSCASAGDLARSDPRRLGDQRQDPLAVRPVPDGDRQHLDRRAPRGLYRRGHRLSTMATRTGGSIPRRSWPRRSIAAATRRSARFRGPTGGRWTSR